ncbi:hypothetical protein B0H10DRAFT_2217050 [Mycena sp. CBHHK59/15]|nr:hypothetical protein B0H10DRAFT_2217050 [Mycena sp. CBHHK59/15]
MSQPSHRKKAKITARPQDRPNYELCTGADEDEWQEGRDEEGMEGTEEENDVAARNQAAFTAEYGFAMEDVEDVQTMSADLEREIFDGYDDD